MFDNSFSNKYTLVFFSFLSLSILFSSCDSKPAEANNTKKPGVGLQVEGFIVKEEPLQNIYQSSGTLLPNEEVNVFSETSGRVTKIYFKEGSNVRKGALLVQLFDGELQAQLQKLQAQKDLQLTTQKRQNELLSIDGISRQEIDITNTQISSIDADISMVKAQLRKLKIYAPFDGVIGLRNISEGAIVSPTTLITTLEQVNPLKLDFSVPERYGKLIPVNAKVYFTVSGLQDTLTGKVAALQTSANENTRTIQIRAIVSNSDRKLTPGSFANVQIPLAENEKAITIPSQAIIPTTRESKVALLKDGKVHLVPVKTGVRLVSNVEILNGLSAGDTIITTGIMQVREGMDVTIKKIVE